jgi:hypothetical protein
MSYILKSILVSLLFASLANASERLFQESVATDELATSFQLAIPTVLRITVVDWNAGISKTHRGCIAGFMSQYGSEDSAYLYATCSLSPRLEPLPAFSGQNNYTSRFEEIGINGPRQYDEHFGCIKVYETTAIQETLKDVRYNLRTITFECGQPDKR